ncbi:MAG: dienelactone hydrolase, partial [Pseudomonadales bacterium]|nr:dienelactone hydrolase [Pseudomonadales bacterium]
MKKVFIFLSGLLFTISALAQTNRIDTVRADAPELANFGEYTIGVRQVEFLARNRVDVVDTPRDGENIYYDRSLMIELWYPAVLEDGQESGGTYQAITRNPEIVATLHGSAVRDAEPDASDGPYPLVVISHGHPGNRFLLSHTAESLASKGYVVASIDHTDSTYESVQNFQSTLYNRPLDQRFVINTLASMEGSDRVLGDMIDGDNVGVIGYSMGGYGLVNNLGGGDNDEMIE